MTADSSPDAGLEGVFRAEHGRVVAALARRFGDLTLAEDAVGEALVVATERWRSDGVPPNPGAWLTTVAGNKALDRLRREKRRQDKYAEAMTVTDTTPPPPTGPVEDDRLRLVFTSCHPALAVESRVALTLRLLGGLTAAEIAAAYLVPETTMAQRLTRAKQKIARAGIPYRIPAPDDLAARLGGVLAVLYWSTTRATSGRRAGPSAPTSPPRRSGWPASCGRWWPGPRRWARSPRSTACSRCCC